MEAQSAGEAGATRGELGGRTFFATENFRVVFCFPMARRLLDFATSPSTLSAIAAPFTFGGGTIFKNKCFLSRVASVADSQHSGRGAQHAHRREEVQSGATPPTRSLKETQPHLRGR